MGLFLGHCLVLFIFGFGKDGLVALSSSSQCVREKPSMLVRLRGDWFFDLGIKWLGFEGDFVMVI